MRAYLIAGLLALSLLVGLLPVAAAQPEPAGTDELVAHINHARVAAGLLPLARSAELDAAAQSHSVDMVQHNYLDHTGSDGSEPQDRAAQAGYRVPPQSGWIVVEVISAISADPQGPVDWWLYSDPEVHGKVLLNPRWREIGAGYAQGGEYGNYWTALFGCRPGVLPGVTFEGTSYTPTEQCGDPSVPAVSAPATVVPTATALATPVPSVAPTSTPSIPTPPTSTPPAAARAPANESAAPRLSATVASNALTVTWADLSNPSATDWLGLYQAGAPDTGYLDWMYVSCTSTPGPAPAAGGCRLPLPAANGRYEARLFRANGYSRLAASDAFTVGSARATLAVTGAMASAGSAVNVRWSGVAVPRPADWIGLYRPDDRDTTPITWMYVGCAAVPLDARPLGSCNVPLPASLSAGAYEFRLFADNAYERLAVAPPIQINAAP